MRNNDCVKPKVEIGIPKRYVVSVLRMAAVVLFVKVQSQCLKRGSVVVYDKDSASNLETSM